MSTQKIEFELTTEDDIRPLHILQGQAKALRRNQEGAAALTAAKLEHFLLKTQETLSALKEAQQVS